MFHVSTGDVIAGFMAVCSVAGLCFAELRHMESRRQASAAQAQADKALAAAEAAKDARDDAQVNTLAGQLERMVAAQEKLLQAFQDHDREDARFHGKIETAVEALKESGEKTARAVGQVQAQVANLSPGADSFVEMRPNRRKLAGG